MSEQELLAFIGEIFVWLLSVAGAAFLLVQFGAQKWIENKFAKNLEAFKAQKLHEFDILLTRKIKWHEKEHEVLSESWRRLVTAHRTLRQGVLSFRTIPLFKRMSDEEYRDYVNDRDFTEYEKNYMLDNKPDAEKVYNKILDHRSLQNSHEAFTKFHEYFEENKIFLRPHIKEKFEKVDDYIWQAWVSHKMSISHPDSKTDFFTQAFDKEDKEIKPLIKEIEDAVQEELFPAQHEERENPK